MERALLFTSQGLLMDVISKRLKKSFNKRPPSRLLVNPHSVEGGRRDAIAA